jgi:integrase
MKEKGKKGVVENSSLAKTKTQLDTFEVKGRIEKFISLYPKQTTRSSYKSAIYNFLDVVFGVKIRKAKFHVSDEENMKYEELAGRYFNEERDYYEDLLRLAGAMNGKAPFSVRSTVSGVKEFMGYNGVEFSQNQVKSLGKKLPKGKLQRTAEKDIEIEALRKILTHMDLKTKAVTLVLVSSGTRIGEVLQVKLADIDLNTTPPQIVVRGEYTKSGDTRTVFISSEAKEVLSEWLKTRDSYLEAAKNKNRGLLGKGIGKEKRVDDDRVFPFSDVNFRESWDNAVKKAGLYNRDSSTKWNQIRVHGLRKFFRSQLALSCPVDIAEALMGHEGYLTEAYRRYTLKQMGEYYLKAEHHVTVMGTGDIREIQDKLQDTHAAVEGYRTIISRQAEEMVEVKKQLEQVREELEGLKAENVEREPVDNLIDLVIEKMMQDEKIKKRLAEILS